MKPSYLCNLSWFCSYTHLVCELIAARDERYDKIPSFRCLSQVLFAIILICWNRAAQLYLGSVQLENLISCKGPEKNS